MLEQKLLFQHKLSEQVKEIEKLNHDIDNLHIKGEEAMEQLDKNALIRQLTNRGHEVLIEKINQVRSNQKGLNVELNILDDSKTGNKGVTLLN